MQSGIRDYKTRDSVYINKYKKYYNLTLNISFSNSV